MPRESRLLKHSDINSKMETVIQDLRYGLRTLIKAPGLLAVTVLTLALGIGANLTIFTLVNAVLLQPLPFPQPERLVRIFDDLNGGEDPATGSAGGCAAAWMVRHGLAKSDEQVLIRQGIEIGRPSEIFVRATLNDDRVSNVRVGGHAIEVLRGTVTL
jgi:hypothetical protein